jgi:hypothetical protein
MDLPSSLSRANSFIAAGTVSIIYAVGNNNVIKIRPTSGEFERQAYEIEIRSYKRLAYYKRIASYEVTEEGLILERGTCLRGMLQSVGESTIPWAMKLQWALEAVEGLAISIVRGSSMQTLAVTTSSWIMPNKSSLLTSLAPVSRVKRP